ncbi:chemotaxis protein CheA [Deferrisoma sp.]
MSAADASVQEFLAEAEDILERLEDDLASLEQTAEGDEPDPEVVNSIFRGAHSLKGISAMCGFSQITEVAHKTETLLDAIRMGRVGCSRPVMDLLYEGLDLLKTLCGRLAGGGEPEDPTVPGFVERLIRAAEGEAAEPQDELAELGLGEDVLAVLTEYERHRLEATLKNPKRTLVRVRVAFPFETFDTDLEALNATLKELGEIISTLPGAGDASPDRMEFQLLVGIKAEVEAARSAVALHGAELEVIGPPKAAPGPAAPEPPPPPPQEAVAPEPVSAGRPDTAGGEGLRSLSQSIRVDLAKLDALMNLVGELVVTRSHIHLVVDRLRQEQSLTGEVLELAKAQKALDRRLAELREAVMEVRMVPLGQLFSKLQRTLHKILRTIDKEVDLEIRGADTEIDKLIAEELSDPLIHVIRNAVDHGIEPPEEREAKGKPRRGRIELAAYQRGNHVVIEVADDGAGISRDRVLRKAVERGLVEPGAELTDKEVFDLLFQPGFSTKDQATEISGRGVGMDVLRKNIARLSGMIELASQEGRGTTVTVVLPITMAIIQALIVRTGDARLAVPLNSVLETVSLEEAETDRIEGRPVLRLRADTLPLARLDRALGMPGDGTPEGGYAVVVGVAEKRMAFAVDELLVQQDVVIKSLGSRLKGVPGIAGATDLGDQRPILVADVASLVKEAAAHA